MLIQLAEPQHIELLHSYNPATKHKIEPAEVKNFFIRFLLPHNWRFLYAHMRLHKLMLVLFAVLVQRENPLSI